MTTLHSSTIGVQSMDTDGSDWIVCMHAHFGQTGEYRGEDVYRLLGDQRQSFDLAGTSMTVVGHQTEAE